MAVVATYVAALSNPRPEQVGQYQGGMAEISFSGSTDYATGGVVINTAALYGLTTVKELILLSIGPVLTAGIFAAAFDKANGKVLLYTSAAAQCANALDISSIKMYVEVRGV